MKAVFLVMAIIGLLLIWDGVTLKKPQSKSLVLRFFNGAQAEAKLALIRRFMIGTGVAALIWTAIGYALHDLLMIEVFILVYFGIFLISGILLLLVLKRRFE